MKIKELTEISSKNNLDIYESMLFDYNNLEPIDKEKLIPSLSNNSIENYLQTMEPIQNGEKVVELIKNNTDKTICVIGDYDCDGICATVILVYALTLCGVYATYTTPDRFVTGYGMKDVQVDTALNCKADIIITVDNGITAFDAIDYAHSKNLKVIVTDHHTPQGENPADLIVNPWYNTDKFKGISGATVAMKIAYLLYKEFNFDFQYMKDFVALAGITCLSDVMPMLGENRLLYSAVQNYLNDEVYKRGSFINRLSKLINFYDPKNESDPYFELDGTFREFTKESIDFYFVPVINAVNRVIGNVDDLVYDIMSLFSGDFNGVATFYKDINTKRKFMKSELLSLYRKNKKNAAVVVLNPGKYEDDYSGIAGLVASSIVEFENKPALVGIYKDKELVHFSGRSVSGFDLYHALEKIKEEHPELSFTFGGHAEALGAAIEVDEVPYVENYLSEEFSKVNIEKIEPTAIRVDSNNILNMISLYTKYWPFGNKFEFPKMYCSGTPTFLDSRNSYFYLNTLGRNIKIKYFSKKIKEKISEIVFNKTKESLNCVLSFMEENGEIIAKLEKYL